ncbi:MAG TPA: sigma 54-interacting transcriptional regulator [Minicystis sp.]|nr:sigma 54-interacting transcriptional regulator [Minicystis sp.]
MPNDETVTLLRTSAAPAAERAYALGCVAGPDRGRSFPLAAPVRALVGQSRACDVVLSDPHVSRRHFACEPTAAGLRVADLGSYNGTFINGVRVESALAGPGDQIAAGETVLVVANHAPAPVLETRTAFGRLVGASPEMRALYPLFDRLGASDIPALIEGETGTGKEVLAEAIHEMGPRSKGPFVVFDCTAVPPNLAESELFGHEKGAFTGALTARRGVFEQADGGTLFIDEIGDLDPALQPKLLRMLERKAVRRVGGDVWIRCDVRVLCATRRDLDREVTEGRFRDDLFYRLVVGRVELPPLRKRRGDVAVLAQAFWESLGRAGPIPFELVRRFERHPFPGNVRELKNTVARHVALGDAPAVVGPQQGAPPAAAAPDPIEQILAMNLPFPEARQLAKDAFERRYLERVLAEHGGSVARAAAASGIARRYFNLILARQRKDDG